MRSRWLFFVFWKTEKETRLRAQTNSHTRLSHKTGIRAYWQDIVIVYTFRNWYHSLLLSRRLPYRDLFQEAIEKEFCYHAIAHTIIFSQIVILFGTKKSPIRESLISWTCVYARPCKHTVSSFNQTCMIKCM